MSISKPIQDIIANAVRVSTEKAPQIDVLTATAEEKASSESFHSALEIMSEQLSAALIGDRKNIGLKLMLDALEGEKTELEYSLDQLMQQRKLLERKSTSLANRGFVRASDKWERYINDDVAKAIWENRERLEAISIAIVHLRTPIFSGKEISGLDSELTYSTHQCLLKALNNEFAHYARFDLDYHVNRENVERFITTFRFGKVLSNSANTLLTNMQNAWIEKIEEQLDGNSYWAREKPLVKISSKVLESYYEQAAQTKQIEFLSALFETAYHQRDKTCPFDETLFKDVFFCGAWSRGGRFPTCSQKLSMTEASLNTIAENYAQEVAKLHGYVDWHEFMIEEQYGPKYHQWFDRIADYYEQFNYANLAKSQQDILNLQVLTQYALTCGEVDFCHDHKLNAANLNLIGFQVDEVTEYGHAVLTYHKDAHQKAPVFRQAHTLVGKTFNIHKNSVTVMTGLDEHGIYLGVDADAHCFNFEGFTLKDAMTLPRQIKGLSYTLYPFDDDNAYITINREDDRLVASLYTSKNGNDVELVRSADIRFEDLFHCDAISQATDYADITVDRISKEALYKQLSQSNVSDDVEHIHLLTVYGAKLVLSYTPLNEGNWDISIDVIVESNGAQKCLGSFDELSTNFNDIADCVLSLIEKDRMKSLSQS